MSKLPVVSAAQCIRALEKTGFVVYRQRGSHLTMVRTTKESKAPDERYPGPGANASG